MRGCEGKRGGGEGEGKVVRGGIRSKTKRGERRGDEGRRGGEREEKGFDLIFISNSTDHMHCLQRPLASFFGTLRMGDIQGWGPWKTGKA
jgi:hypothetical protein